MLCSYEPGETLSDHVVTDVREALVTEWRSEALYDDLARQIGRPFPRLERSEERHADALVRLLDAHGQLAPQSPDLKTTEATSPAQACALALENERANVAMYDRLIANGPPADVKCVYEHLREMSVLRHIPALERCGGAGP
jgi:hypothetical protein